jgi:hypothetical protein
MEISANKQKIHLFLKKKKLVPFFMKVCRGKQTMYQLFNSWNFKSWQHLIFRYITLTPLSLMMKNTMAILTKMNFSHKKFSPWERKHYTGRIKSIWLSTCVWRVRIPVLVSTFIKQLHFSDINKYNPFIDNT